MARDVLQAQVRGDHSGRASRVRAHSRPCEQACAGITTCTTLACEACRARSMHTDGRAQVQASWLACQYISLVKLAYLSGRK